MHKSVSIFIIFLIALSLMTFSGSIFSNAMAIEQEGVYFETDEYMQYVNDMANYFEDKYQQYANDNHVKKSSNDFVKKIKCNNISFNLNGLDFNTLPGSATAEDLGIQVLQQENSGSNDISSNGFGNNEKRNNGNFEFDCVNNNNNVYGQGHQRPLGITQFNDANLY